jgi:AcrR family transcriptional regulator
MAAESRSGTTRVRRLSAAEARHQALEAARELLLKHGPAGVTLNNIAGKLQRSHATLIHHFGCAEKLQAALMTSMVEDLSRSLSSAIAALEPGPERARAVVDIVFDAFNRDGAGLLAAWIMLSHREKYLEPVRGAVRALMEGVDQKLAEGEPNRERQLPVLLLFLTLSAFGDALIGDPLSRILDRDRDTMRSLATQLLPSLS